MSYDGDFGSQASSGTPQAPPQYSADGKWWWNGSEWQAVAPPPAPAYSPAVTQPPATTGSWSAFDSMPTNYATGVPPTGLSETARPLLIASAIAGGVATLGSMLPWATVQTGFGNISKTGTDGDGMFTLLAGVGAAGVAIAALVSGRLQTWQRWMIAVCGALIALVGVIDVVDVTGTGNEFFEVSVGIGLWMVLLAGIALLVAGVKLVRSRS